MMVTFISQCEKKALRRTRRVLDAFADRIGDNAWQTIITQEGLLAVKKLLRKSATKNTAVSCHWIRSRARSELVWVVGNGRKFDREGRVPVNTTQNGSPNTEHENRWRYAHAMQIVAVLAALLHDIGKATEGFQKKLLKGGAQGDPYRHEWVSLRLFQAMLHGCDRSTDDAWLERLIHFDNYLQATPNWLNHWHKDSGKATSAALEELPPLAQLVCWLIVTHHRLPTYGMNYYRTSVRHELQVNPRFWDQQAELPFNMERFYKILKPYPRWVRNENVEESPLFWSLQQEIVRSKSWQRQIKRWARKAQENVQLRNMALQTISDPLFMHLSRLCLMLGDHNYSRLESNSRKREKGDAEFAGLAANTDKGRKVNQALDEHLLGVGEFAKRVARELPQLPRKLRRLNGLPEKHAPFLEQAKRTPYLWQNSAFALARKMEAQCREQGFFGINMASTGRGKTLANARIMYALTAPDEGARFTIALGLRVLTLQTGKALQERLSLNDEDLAVLVGGAANKKLFELARTEEEEMQSWGSESQEPLLSNGDIVYGSLLPDEFGSLLDDPHTLKLLAAPVVTCTVDHIMQASECSRGGRYIAPVLRLLTSDLVLDEPDDFDQNDLPALSRLVHLAGMYGSKVLLSSATLTPDMVAGLFQAYSAGRKVWNKHMGWNPAQSVPCAWFDEYDQTSQLCQNAEQFQQWHRKFVASRIKALIAEPARRVAEIIPCDFPQPKENQKIDMAAFARTIVNGAIRLHKAHAQACPTSGKQASIGLMRMANVSPLIQLVHNLYQYGDLPEGIQLHLCCYHAKQLLILRNALEQKLDRILHRGYPDPFITQPEIQHALAASEAKHHIFIVVASPVAEVGRDHDYDWAIVELSSMRSLIQLAGRVGRHRPNRTPEQPNVLILDRNIRALKRETLAFQRPGFEQEGRFQLQSHYAHELLAEAELEKIDSIPRIRSRDDLTPNCSLADLEHAVMADLLNNPANFVSAWWHEGSGNRASAHLQKISPFRFNERREQDYVCLPLDESAQKWKFVVAENAWDNLEHCNYAPEFRFESPSDEFRQVIPWLESSLEHELPALAEQLGEGNLREVARKYSVVRLEDNGKEWHFHPQLGFWQ